MTKSDRGTQPRSLIPTVDKAYGMVRRETVNEKELKPETDQSEITTGLDAFDRSQPFPPQVIKFTTNWRQEKD